MKYSFHENDSDFLTAHWILIVICAATIYVGRRYFAGLVITKGIGIPHAVSRRRRILRDPVSRRPPPLLTYVRFNNDVCSRSNADHARKVTELFFIRNYPKILTVDNKAVCVVATRFVSHNIDVP